MAARILRRFIEGIRRLIAATTRRGVNIRYNRLRNPNALGSQDNLLHENIVAISRRLPLSPQLKAKITRITKGVLKLMAAAGIMTGTMIVIDEINDSAKGKEEKTDGRLTKEEAAEILRTMAMRANCRIAYTMYLTNPESFPKPLPDCDTYIKDIGDDDKADFETVTISPKNKSSASASTPPPRVLTPEEIAANNNNYIRIDNDDEFELMKNNDDEKENEDFDIRGWLDSLNITNEGKEETMNETIPDFDIPTTTAPAIPTTTTTTIPTTTTTIPTTAATIPTTTTTAIPTTATTVPTTTAAVDTQSPIETSANSTLTNRTKRFRNMRNILFGGPIFSLYPYSNRSRSQMIETSSSSSSSHNVAQTNVAVPAILLSITIVYILS